MQQSFLFFECKYVQGRVYSDFQLSLLAFSLLVCFVLLLNLGEAGCHDTTTVDEGHGHVLIGDALDEVGLVDERLAILGEEELADGLLRATTLKRARRHLRLVLVRVDRRVGREHRDREQQLVYRKSN